MRRFLSLTCLVLSTTLAPTAARGETTAELEAPREVSAGSDLEVRWTGPGGDTDFISIDPAGAPERQYGGYKYAREGSPLTLRAPDEPGDYEIRYHLGDSGYPVAGSIPLRVKDVEATIETQPTAAAGTEISVRWTGPETRGDFISVDPAGAPERRYGAYKYARDGSPLTLRAPDEPGDYEVRYHLGQSYRVVAAAPLRVGAVDAGIEAPSTVLAGSELSIAWSGPDDPRDFVSLDPAGAPEREYGPYKYTTEGSPLTLRAPDEPGDYEIRYHTGQTYKVLATSPLTVTGASATVSPPAQAEAGQPFAVEWTGPDQERDFIAIVAAGAPEREYGNYAYTKRGSPLRIEAPEEPGRYEVRYLTGQRYLTLASAPIEVVPGKTPGELRVLGAAAGAEPAAGAVEMVLDASGSMLQKLGGKRRIDLAKEALSELAREVLPAGTPFALRVFGHREADSCRTDLEIPLSPLEPAAAAARIASIEAKNLAKTPIAESLRRVREDLAGSEAPRLVVLVTDGEETCDGDPAAAIDELRAAGFDVRVSIVGFAIDELMLKEDFESWARRGGGRYFDARDGDELARAVRGSLGLPFEVLAGDEVVASGTVGGEAIELAPGRYRVRVLSAPPRELGEVVIEAGGEHELRLD